MRSATALTSAFERWHEWASRQRDFIVNGKPGITEDEYQAVARRFAGCGNHDGGAGRSRPCG